MKPSRRQFFAAATAGPIEAGYHHCVPALMAMRAFDTGLRQIYDPERREIRAG